MKSTFRIFSFLLIITGCKKIDTVNTTNLQGTYQTSKIISVQSPIMYLQNRQITDTGIINIYLRRHNAINNFIYAPTQLITDTLLTIVFGINDSANFKYNNSPVFLKAKKIEASSNELLIQRYDSILLPLSSYPETFYRCDTLGRYISKFPPLFHYNLVPVSTGLYGWKVITPRFPLLYQSGELRLSLITSLFNATWNYPTSWGNCFVSNKDSWLIKGNNIENNLSLTDTIVVQEKSVVLNKIE